MEQIHIISRYMHMKLNGKKYNTRDAEVLDLEFLVLLTVGVYVLWGKNAVFDYNWRICGFVRLAGRLTVVLLAWFDQTWHKGKLEEDQGSVAAPRKSLQVS